jgi:hypothetical protein
MDQLIVFSYHQPPCAAQGYSRRLRAAVDSAPPADGGELPAITVPVSHRLAVAEPAGIVTSAG